MLTFMIVVGDYSKFIEDWNKPDGGIHGYLRRFLSNEDPTFQHIAIWTLLQLLEADDKQLRELIAESRDVLFRIREIADRNLESDDEEEGENECEVVGLARRCRELLPLPAGGP
jgi:vacuolar protein 8